MRRAIVALLLSVFMFAVSGVAFAQKTTVDPNASPPPLPPDSVTKPDERLAQKVTFEARHKTVAAICAELAEKTGVTLRSGWNEKDWQVRDRKMNIFAKDVPLSDLMSSIARVMKFKWEIGNKDTVRTYRLFADRKTMSDAEEQRQREESERERKMNEKRQKLLDSFAGMDKLSPQELQKLKEDNPFMYVAAKSGVAGSLGKFFQESPMAMEALATGQEMNLGAGDMSPMGQQALVQSMTAMAQLRMRMGDRRASIPDEFAAGSGQMSVQLNRHMQDVKNMPMAGSMLGEISVRMGDDNVDLPLFDPDSKMAKLMGKAILRSEEDGRPMDEVMRGMQSEMMMAVMSEIKKDDSGEPAIEHKEDPALDTKIKLKPKENKLEEIEAALSEASAFAVVADSFGGMRIPGSIGEEEAPVKDVLNKIADTYHYNWNKRDEVIELRDRNWYRKRLAQIPEARLEAWRTALKETGTLDIDDLADIAGLTQEEFNVNLMSDEVLSRANITQAYFRSRDVLRVYGALDEGRRAAIFSSDGLNLRALGPEQWAQVEKLLSQRSASMLQSESPIVLRVTRTEHGKCFDYKFTLTAEDSEPPIAPSPVVDWSFTTPEYKEPENKQN